MAEHHRKNNKEFIAEIEEEPVVKRLAFLDLVLENSDFTEDELESEVHLFLLAGTETTASALTFVLTVLGVLQDVQQKVYEEMIDAIGPDEIVCPLHLRKLHYTERVIKETLRMFSIATFFSRHVTEDLDLGDLVIPKGANVGFAVSRMHSNEAYWPDPTKFDPDRFLPENAAKRHPFAYLPFSAGPRNCIGWRYAMMSMKTILANIVRNVRIFSEYKSLEEIELKMSVLLRLKHGPKIWLESR
ncbi:unnamed protein product [Callosobruchus maculatus]|uniref:Cytochrome P450 n=1 Tax=Callosobruchus maculatus TaxID=64391 RepID=A0A653DGA4_CALMS|nr:unnamed protein product [Callosobruchus maculatus]